MAGFSAVVANFYYLNRRVWVATEIEVSYRKKNILEERPCFFYVVFFGSNPPVSLHRQSVTATEREE